MATVVLKAGEALDVVFQDSDALITITFNMAELSIHADLPDSDGRKGRIYSERFLENVEVNELGSSH